MTLIEHQGQEVWKKYFYPTEDNKDEEFYSKMNKMVDELAELNRLKKLKEKEIEEYLESIDFNFADINPEAETDYTSSFEKIKVDGRRILKRDLPKDFWDYPSYTRQGKVQEEIEEKSDWYVTTEECDEGWFDLEVDEEFDLSKLKWDGSSLTYGDESVSDNSGTKKNSDVHNWFEVNKTGDDDEGGYWRFYHRWYP